MAGIAWYVATALVTLGAFAVGLKMAGRKRWALGAAVGALSLLLVKCALNKFPVVEAWLFPWPWYVYLQGYWLWPVTLLFFGLAVRQLPVRWNRIVIVGVAGVMFAVSLYTARWMVSPPDDLSQRRADTSGHCMQSTGYTCVPASCVAVLAWWGIDTTEGEMARLCLTSSWGTSAFNAYRGLTLKLREVASDDRRDLNAEGGGLAGFRMKPSGLDVRIVKWDADALRALAVPAVVTGDIRHAVAVRFDDDTFVIDDPLTPGPVRYHSPPKRITGPAVVIMARDGNLASR